MLQPFFLAEILIEIWLDLKTFRAAGIDLGQDKLALQRLREASGVAKVELSSKAPKGTEGHRKTPSRGWTSLARCWAHGEFYIYPAW